MLRFTPTTWAKLVYLCDVGPTEVGGFGISSFSDPMLIEDFQLVRQECDWASVAFDDEAVADYFDQQVDSGRQPEEFGRIWIHTHPGNSAQPSSIDEETFNRVFGTNPWALMFILARGGASYARLRFNVGPGGEQVLPVEVDYQQEFSGTSQVTCQEEYDLCVQTTDSLIAEERIGIVDQYIDPFEVEDESSWWSHDDDLRSWEETESEVNNEP
jgi:proteasome lid subunit RPN8/RPN11